MPFEKSVNSQCERVQHKFAVAWLLKINVKTIDHALIKRCIIRFGEHTLVEVLIIGMKISLPALFYVGRHCTTLKGVILH